MNRRDFIKRTSLASGTFFVPNFMKASHIFDQAIKTHKRLIIIQLSGGNDGLNTIVPFRNDVYYKSRSTISQPVKSVIKLTDELGMHESLSGLKKLYDSGELSIINGVGYPNPNRSHFRSTDIWQSASDSHQYWSTGWVGRVLDHSNSKSYAAIEIEDSLSLLLKGHTINGIATKNPALFYRTSQEPYFKNVLAHQTDMHLSEHNLGYLYKSMIAAENTAHYIYQTSKTYSSKVSYPNNVFGKQLQTIAQLINSGLQTEVYYASLGGFDTHANQIGTQKRLLKVYDEAITTLVKDLKSNRTFSDTLILTFSEFGRRVKQNGANGTDHGTANNVFLIGGKLKKPGLYNDLPSLIDLDQNADLKYTIDFREVYASILSNWLEVDAQKILKKQFKPLHVI